MSKQTAPVLVNNKLAPAARQPVEVWEGPPAENNPMPVVYLVDLLRRAVRYEGTDQRAVTIFDGEGKRIGQASATPGHRRELHVLFE